MKECLVQFERGLHAKRIHARVRRHFVHLRVGGETAALRGGGLNFGTANQVSSAAPLAAPEDGWPMRRLAQGYFGFGRRFKVQATPHARHNTLVNRTCCGSADRAVTSFFARSALPQQAGYRQRCT